MIHNLSLYETGLVNCQNTSATYHSERKRATQSGGQRRVSWSERVGEPPCEAVGVLTEML